MGLFKKRAADTAEIERLRSEIAGIAARLDAADHRLDSRDDEQAALGERVQDLVIRLDTKDSEQAALGARVRDLVIRLDTPLAPAPEPPPLPPPTVSPAELAAVRDRIDELVARLEGVDARVTAISVELANQIDELSGELASKVTADAPADEVVEELRDAQTRLANEQVRYQIAFRQDLAELADRLRRG